MLVGLPPPNNQTKNNNNVYSMSNKFSFALLMLLPDASQSTVALQLKYPITVLCEVAEKCLTKLCEPISFEMTSALTNHCF